ncbi:C40 family peptidase [Clostridium paraputrificum]|uniref:C40 family peptidase n=1 Tax=Clostridium paraputrificum TaxID=29363 RepID=UPI00325BB545
MISKRKILTKAVAITVVCAAVAMVGAESISADTSAKTKQGVVLKTSELKVNKVIVSPKKVEEQNTVQSSRSSNTTGKKNTNSSINRGVNKSSSQVANYAYNFLGRPYVYGANGPNAFDCSGFTSYVYRHFGVSLPRTARSQFSAGSAVSRDNLAPGDLVFFNTVGYLGHVGLYIGGGDFIHAASSGRVKISSLSEGYYRTRYAGARRVF